MKLSIVLAVLLMLPAGLLAMPTAKPHHDPLTSESVAAKPAEAQAKPLGRDAFVWQEAPSALPHAEVNRRLLEGLGRCSQFAVETRTEADKSIHDIFFRVGENRSPWPIGRIELTPLKQGSQVTLGQNKQFSMGIGKFQKMWAGYLEEKYECPPQPGKHPGGMHHP